MTKPTRARREKSTGADAGNSLSTDAKIPTAKPVAKGKIVILVDQLRNPDGATIAAMMAATGWQAHSVRGAISGSIKKALGIAVMSEKTEAGRTYRIAAEAVA